jgi:hypothetical protein
MYHSLKPVEGPPASHCHGVPGAGDHHLHDLQDQRDRRVVGVGGGGFLWHPVHKRLKYQCQQRAVSSLSFVTLSLINVNFKSELSLYI